MTTQQVEKPSPSSRFLSCKHVLCTEWKPASVIFLTTFIVYLLTLCPGPFVEGTGENIVCVWTFSVPHPPGFPLFCILGKIFATLLPLGSVAFRVNLFAGLMGAVTIAGLYLLLRQLSLAVLAAAAAALCLAFSLTFWREATIAEVYTLSLAVMVIQLALLLSWRRRLPKPAAESNPHKKGEIKKQLPAQTLVHIKLFYGFAFFYGLGFTVHYHHLLLAPAFLFFFCCHDRVFLRRQQMLLAGAGFFLVGFSLHLYTPIASFFNPPIDWGNPQTLRNLWDYLSAHQYRGMMFHLPWDKIVNNLMIYTIKTWQEFTFLGLLLIIPGAWLCCKRDRAFFHFLAMAVITLIVWAINYDIPWEIEVYYLPGYFFMTVFIGYALDGLHRLLQQKTGRRFAPVILLFPLCALALHWRENDLSKQTFVMDNVEDILTVIDPDSHLILPNNNPTFAMIYLKNIDPRAAQLQLWTRSNGNITSIEQGVFPEAEKRLITEPYFLAQTAGKGQPVYTVDRQADASLPGFVQIPWACVYRIVAKEAPRPLAPNPLLRFNPEQQTFRFGEEQKMLACRQWLVAADYAAEQGQLAVADSLYSRALRLGENYPSLPGAIGQRYLHQGREEAALTMYRALLKKKDDADLHLKLGAILGRRNQLDEAKIEFEQALRLQPDLAEAHANLASVYGRRNQLAQAAVELEAALKYDPNHVPALLNLANYYQKTNRQLEAQKLWARAKQIDPTLK